MNFGDCFNCGEPGHIAADCPARRAAPPEPPIEKPQWCGACDPKTRLIDHGTLMQRCPACHPLRWQHLPQHKRCGGCNLLVYSWDVAPCGKHQPLAA